MKYADLFKTKSSLRLLPTTLPGQYIPEVKGFPVTIIGESKETQTILLALASNPMKEDEELETLSISLISENMADPNYDTSVFAKLIEEAALRIKLRDQ